MSGSARALTRALPRTRAATGPGTSTCGAQAMPASWLSCCSDVGCTLVVM